MDFLSIKNDEINQETRLSLYDDRYLVLQGEINDDVMNDIVLHILLWNKRDQDVLPEKRVPIKILISSEGGSMFCANNLCDVILASNTPIYGIVFDIAASAASSVLIACHKRYGFKNSVVLMHEGKKMVYDSSAKAQQTMDFLAKMDIVDKQLVIERTNVTEEQYELDKEKEQYMFANEAKEKGIIDGIIGIDVDLDSIF